MTAIDEHEQLHAPRASVIEEGIEGGANGAPGVEHIVDQDHVAAVDVEAERAGDDNGANIARGKIVAIEADVEDTGVDGVLLDTADQRAEALGNGDTAPLDADQADGLRAVVFLDDLMRQANQGALNLRRGHNPPLLAQSGRSSSLQF